MSTFKKCPKEINDLANEIMCETTDHKLLLDAKVKIDFLFAYADVDERGLKRGHAIIVRSMRALGYARRIGLKERVKGQGDAEIVLDGDWWLEHDAKQCRALLDHELTHIQVVTDKHGRIQWDDIMRPKIKLRPHDFEFGWFASVAKRHGHASQERIQAKTILDAAGQYLWPDLLKGLK